MELVYLWVEEYKNIKRQGFNFSPRFRCEFKDEYKKDKDGNEVLKDDCELIIEENEDYVSIFPENINVTAIVGENGSGKSSLLELINKDGYENPLIRSYPIFYYELKMINVYYVKKENQFYLENRNLNVITINKTCIQEKNEPYNSFQNVFIIPTAKHTQKEYLLLLRFFTENNIKFPFDIPKFVNVGIHDDFVDLLQKIKTSDFDILEHYSPFESNSRVRFKVFHVLLLLGYLQNYKIDFKIDVLKDYDDVIKKLENFININICTKIKNFIKMIEDNEEVFSEIPNHYIDIKNISNDFFNTYIEIIKRKNNDKLLDFKGKNIFNFHLYPNMSDGQYQFSYLFNMIYSSIREKKVMLFIDEGENYLHPNWQKKYLTYIIKFIKDNYPNEDIHIILATHSPFILSDIPKESIVFLEKDEKTGNCINATEEMKDFNTFGANIHTLLSHGFFMKDGLMGEFAKSKIESIKDFYEECKDLKIEAENYNNKKNEYLSKKNEFRYIQSIIGEPFIKNIMKNYLDELDILFIGKNEFIDEEIKRLEAMKD